MMMPKASMSQLTFVPKVQGKKKPRYKRGVAKLFFLLIFANQAFNTLRLISSNKIDLHNSYFKQQYASKSF